MANKVHLQLRQTRRYNDGWAHLDQWKYVGSAKLLPRREERQGNGHDDLGTYIVRAIVKPSAGATLSQARQAMQDHYSGSSCQHEFDCCGCRIQSARVLHARGRNMVLRVSEGRNY